MIRRSTRELISRYLALALSALFVNSIIPILPVHASLSDTSVRAAVGPVLAVGNPHATLKPYEPAPEPQPKAKRKLTIRVTAYSSTRDQTDSDPFTTASGAKVTDGTFAMNCVPFGTKIRIPAKFGDRVFTVQDRMNSKWGCARGDIWMPSRALAKQWGIRTVTIEIL